jgi:hypothetical protein
MSSARAISWMGEEWGRPIRPSTLPLKTTSAHRPGYARAATAVL